MRTMRMETVCERYKTPLVVRGSLPRTFRTLALVTEISLRHLPADQSDRTASGSRSTSVIGAGVMLALASTLLFYMVWPLRKEAMAQRETRRSLDINPLENVLTAYGETIARQRAQQALLEDAEDLPGPM
jgi:hypothetical protein